MTDLERRLLEILPYQVYYGNDITELLEPILVELRAKERNEQSERRAA